MDWKRKSALFRLLSAMPLGDALHFQLQRRVTRQWPRPTQALDELLVAARRIWEASDGHHDHLLEIGAGRDLAVAVALRMLGARHVRCVDVSRLAGCDLISHAARHMASRLGMHAPALRNWRDVEEFGISYLAPATLQQAALEPASVDCFYSVDTLEHIPPAELPGVFKEARRILKGDGVCIQLVDYSDHYARDGAGLSRFNFLTYSNEDWQPFNSRLQYVNRLRHSDFMELFRQSGMRLASVAADREPADAGILERLAPEFRRYSVEDLFIVRAMIVALT